MNVTTNTSEVTFHLLHDRARSIRTHFEPRTEVLNMVSVAGGLASHFMSISSEKDCGENSKDELEIAMGELFLALFHTANSCSLDLCRCVKSKLKLNAKKYPVELCKGKSGKYTKYSDETGITKTKGQSTVGDQTDLDSSDDSNVTVKEVSSDINKFVADRLWEPYHTKRNLMLALIGEIGELAELFQWKGDGNVGAPIGLTSWDIEEKDKVGQELADVSIYLLRLAVQSNVDIGKAAMNF